MTLTAYHADRVMSNSHRPPDTTRRSCLCRVGRCELSLETVWPKSEQLADRSPSSRGVLRRSLGLVICSSPQRVYILRGVQRRCVWAVGRLGVAACLACVAAAAVDRQARQSCRVQCAGMNLAIALNVFRLQMFCRR